MADVRIFSYLPNPRVYKATIAGRLNGVSVEVIGASPAELKDWLWDFDARPLSEEERASGEHLTAARTGFSGELHKTKAFLAAHPYGTVPAAFSADGQVGVFESNSILRAVARLGNEQRPLYGRTAWAASRIDGFLDTALLFARDSQRYLLGIGDRSISLSICEEMAAGLRRYLQGIDNALAESEFIAGSELSIADIAFACELCLFMRERVAVKGLAAIGTQPLWPIINDEFPHALRHFDQLVQTDGISEDLKPYVDKVDADILARA